jgi:phenylpropionate dioxygenase-like ring-hydroxylating dioxygenase large terminal subunit
MTLVSDDRSGVRRLLDDRSMVERIFQHIDAGTTDLSSETWREPVENYRTGERLAAELRRVLRRHPTPFCPSAALPDVGSYLARDAAGIPILAVRGHDGTVRAFRNACRHRGMAVASGSGCGRSLVCPYHGWVYRLDGMLRHIPHDDGFPQIDKATTGLVPVEAGERAGLVFVTQDGETGSALDDLPDLVAPDQRLLGSSEREIAANWKILLEGFLEGYHIRSTHPQTFYPFGFDNLNVVETFGQHSRVTFPFRRIDKLRDVPPAQRRVDGLLTYVYQVFPNVVIAVLSHHTTMVVLEPLTPATTRMLTYTMTNRGRDDEEGRRAAERDTEFGSDGNAEDIAVACAIQKGLASGANDAFTYGRFEGAITHFHRQLDAALAA